MICGEMTPTAQFAVKVAAISEADLVLFFFPSMISLHFTHLCVYLLFHMVDVVIPMPGSHSGVHGAFSGLFLLFSGGTGTVYR
jgi:hypothetical protein